MYLYFLGAMMIFWVVFLVIIFRLETRMAWPYGDLRPTPHFEDSTGYARKQLAEAEAAGFKLLGWTRDMKGNLIRVTYAMLVSQDRTTFAVIGVGTILKAQLAATWLHTPTADGRSFYSTNAQSGVQLDLSRNWTNQLILNATFTRLCESHRAWIRESQVVPRGFTEGREMDEFRNSRIEHFQFMERAGLIRYTDASNSHFRYTTFGAAKTASLSYFLGLLRGLTDGRFPKTI